MDSEEKFLLNNLDKLSLISSTFRNSSTFINSKMASYIKIKGEKIISDENLLKNPIEFT